MEKRKGSLNRRQFLKSLAVAGSALATTGMLGINRRRAFAQGTTELTFGYLPLSSFVQVFLAEDLGYLKEAGITLKYERVDSGAKAKAFLASGELDMAGGGVAASLFNALTRGFPIKLVAEKGMYLSGLPGSAQILVRKDLYDRGVRSLKDLKGLKVAGSARGSVSHYYLANSFERAGLSEKDVDLVFMPFPQMISALAGKAIDACEEVEPFVTRAISLGHAVSIVDLADLFPNEQYAHLFYGQKFISAKPKLAQAFVEAYVRGIRKYYELGPYHDTVLASLEKHTNVKKEVTKKLVPVFFDINGDINMGGLKQQHDWFVKTGLSQKVELANLVDRSFLSAVWEKIGKKENPGKEWWDKVKLPG